MAYVAVTGGGEAVDSASVLVEMYRKKGNINVETKSLENRMSLLIDRIMGEAGFYAPEYASLALKQCEGSPDEAVFLLRAYRSTLTRAYCSLPLDGQNINLQRRISAAFKDIAGGQFLGATYDYTHRLLNFELNDEGFLNKNENGRSIKIDTINNPIKAPRVSDELRNEGLISTLIEESEPVDITQNPISFPAPRSARLQTLARADTGFITGLAYAGIRGFGPGHPTVGELRTGTLEILISHPLIEGEVICAGEIVVTEVEGFFNEEDKKVAKDQSNDPLRRLSAGQGDKADTSSNSLSIGCGYGMVFGRSDNKAIAMSILDYSLESGAKIFEETVKGNTSVQTNSDPKNSILQNQEFVLLHGDCLEMNGFISHLKLPHYVTFQSKLDRVRHTRQDKSERI